VALSWSSPAKTTAVASGWRSAAQYGLLVLLHGSPALFDLRPATPGIDGPAASMIMKSAGRWERNATSRIRSEWA
jgi:hypothetical protein